MADLMTPVLKMLHAVYGLHAASPQGRSWNRLNDALCSQLHTLITVGAVFARTDFQTLAADPRLAFGHWAGVDSARMSGEQFYRAAVISGNRSACLSFEGWKGRKPFLWRNQRLAMGAQLVWEGERVQVTSFDDAQGTITLCSYEDMVWQACRICHHHTTSPGRKLKHRYALTPAQLRAGDATRRQRVRVEGGASCNEEGKV